MLLNISSVVVFSSRFLNFYCFFCTFLRFFRSNVGLQHEYAEKTEHQKDKISGGPATCFFVTGSVPDKGRCLRGKRENFFSREKSRMSASVFFFPFSLSSEALAKEERKAKNFFNYMLPTLVWNRASYKFLFLRYFQLQNEVKRNFIYIKKTYKDCK